VRGYGVLHGRGANVEDADGQLALRHLQEAGHLPAVGGEVERLESGHTRIEAQGNLVC